MSQSSQNLTVVVVVSGQPPSLKTNVHQSIEKLVTEALKDTGNKGQPSSEWELRRLDGGLVEQTLTVEAAGLIEGMTLYLSPRAGAGGMV